MWSRTSHVKNFSLASTVLYCCVKRGDPTTVCVLHTFYLLARSPMALLTRAVVRCHPPGVLHDTSVMSSRPPAYQQWSRITRGWHGYSKWHVYVLFNARISAQTVNLSDVSPKGQVQLIKHCNYCQCDMFIEPLVHIICRMILMSGTWRKK